MKVDLALCPVDAPARSLVEAARLAEAVGFDGVWTYDHMSGVVLGGRSVRDVWAMLGAIAAETSTIELGPLVVNTTVRHPAHIAVAAATLQELSGGRLGLGLGAGAGPAAPFAGELRMVGITPLPAATRRAIVADTIGFLRGLWTGKPSYTGPHAQFDDVSGLVVPDPVPSIIVGANGPKMAELAGRLADGVNFHSRHPDLAGLATTARTAAAEAGNEGFVVTIEGLLDDPWLEPGYERRAVLDDLDVVRLMLHWTIDNGLEGIRRAGEQLAALRP